MRKFLTIIILSFLWSTQGNSAEKIYCLDLNKQFNTGGYLHQAFVFDKNSVKQCKDRNKSLIDTSSSIKRNLIEISEEFYNSPHFANTFPKQIKTQKLKQVASQFGLKLSSGSSSIVKCFDELKFSWFLDGNYAKFEFTSSSEKPINISQIIIKTNDRKTVLEENVSVNLKPFGLGSSSVYIGDRNKDVLEKGNYRCTFGSKSKTVSTKKKTSKNTDGWFRWWYILIGLGILGVLGSIAEGKSKPKSKNYMPFSNKSKSTKSLEGNFIEDIWEGRESLAKAFWLYLVLINFVFSFIVGALSAVVGLWVLIFTVGYNIWISVGTWRSADNYKNEKLKLKQGYGYAMATKIYIVLALAGLLSQIGFMIR